MTNGLSSDRRSGEDRRIRQERFQGPDRRSGRDRRGPGYVNGLRRSEAVAVAKSLAVPAKDGPEFPPTLREMLDRIGDVLTDLVGRFYEASMDARLWPETLAKLRDVLHADTCAIVSHDFGTGSGRLEHSVNIDSMYVSAYTDYYASHNPWLHNRGALGTAGSVWTSQQLANDGDVSESDFYRFWLRPQNVMHHLFGVIQAEKDRMLLIVFARGPERGAFWQDDSDLLRRLLPVLHRGLAAGRAHEHSRGIQRLALDTLDAMPIGVIMLNNVGGVLAANRFGRELIDSEEVLGISGGNLTAEILGKRVRFRDILEAPVTARSADRPADAQTLFIPRAAPMRPLTVLVAPVQDHTQEPGRDDPAALVFIGDPERPVPMDPRRLTRLYGLSRAEARVAALVGQGKRLDEAAAVLGLTYETVRKHLKQIFAKTATDRQAELVRVLTLGPGGLRL